MKWPLDLPRTFEHFGHTSVGLPMFRLIACLIVCHRVALAWVPSNGKWGRFDDLRWGHDRGTRSSGGSGRERIRPITSPVSGPPAHRIRRLGLSMGLLDSLSNFLQARSGDFIQLQESEDRFGPGPILLLYNFPPGINNEELVEMVSDGAPSLLKGKEGCVICRLNDQSPELDLSVQDALETLVDRGSFRSTGQFASIVVGSSFQSSPSRLVPLPNVQSVPVLLFSGFVNSEMLEVYSIIGKEVYDETEGLASTACAKAVPNAMAKPLRQVLSEIAGDHRDAMRLDT